MGRKESTASPLLEKPWLLVVFPSLGKGSSHSVMNNISSESYSDSFSPGHALGGRVMQTRAHPREKAVALRGS